MYFMRRSMTVLASCLLLVAPGCAPADDAEEAEAPAATEEMQPAAEQPPADLTSADQAYIAAWNAEDAAAVAEFFADDATAKLGDSTYTGRDQIRTVWIEPTLPMISDLQTTTTTSEHRGEDWYSTGTYTHQTVMEGKAPITETGRYAVTWMRTPEGQWRIRSTEIMPDAPATNTDTTQ
jgi:uncharacterized protein (TIGR02246 family)